MRGGACSDARIKQIEQLGVFWLRHGLRTSDDSFELRDQFKGFHELCEFDVLAEVLKASTSISLRDDVGSKDEVL